MRVIKNTTLQGFDIPFLTENGLINVYVKPGKKIDVPDHYVSTSLDNLIKRRMFKVIKTIHNQIVTQNINTFESKIALENKTVSKKTTN